MLVATHELDVNSGSEQVYNAMDTCLTHEVYAELSQKAQEAQPAYEFELALQAPVMEMMLRGFLVNPAARELGIQSTKAELDRLDYIVQTLANAVWDKGLNPGSGPQLKSLFYDHLAIPPIVSFVKGEKKWQMNRDTLEQIEDYFQARPIVNAILAHRDLSKQLEVLLNEVDPDWRMRTTYNIGGTKAARFSSSKSPTGTGGNFQNVTEHLRHIFIADPGYRLYGVDAEQSDSRNIGFMCGVLFNDWTYLDACESGDLHTSVARMVFADLPWTGDLKKDRGIAEGPFYRHFSYRDACKHLGHGVNFLGKPYTMSKGTHVPVKDIITFSEKYFGAFPCLQQWQSWTAAEIQKTQRLVSIHGRHRDFFDRTNKDETVRKALAFLAAAPTADNLNLGMWRVWKHMPHVKLLAQVHDAIYFETLEKYDPNEVVKEVHKHMVTELVAPNGRRFSIPCDAKVGYNWGNYIPPNEKLGLPERNAKGLRKFKVTH